MRILGILSGFLLLLGYPTSGNAQTVQKQITQSQAEVHCQPGDLNGTIFVTNTLNAGEWISLVEDLNNGWLKILPPRGSFSWIRKKDLVAALYPNPNYQEIYIVNNDGGTKTFVGSDREPKKKESVFGATLPRGTQVMRVQRDSYFDHEGEWLPIVPPEPNGPNGEYRYLRKEAVANRLVPVAAKPNDPFPGNHSTFTGTTTSAAQPGITPLPPMLPGTLAPQQMTEAQKMWQKAQQAERSGDLNQAMELYSQMATRTPSNSFDHDLAMQGLNRVYFLRESQRNPVTNTIPTLPASTMVANETRSNGSPGIPVSRNAAQSNSAPNPYPPGSTPVPTVPIVTSNFSPDGNPLQPAQKFTTCVGNLTRSGRGVANRKTYVFQGTDPSGASIRLYASPQTGIDLDPFLDHRVELTGPMVYNGELRANYMIVEHVRVVP